MGFRYETVEKVTREQVRVEAICDRCGGSFETHHGAQPSEGAYITMHGYYGGYIDLEDYEWFLCDNCCGWLEGVLSNPEKQPWPGIGV